MTGDSSATQLHAAMLTGMLRQQPRAARIRMNAATRALLAAAALSILGGDASAQRLPRAAVLEDIDTLQAVVRRYSAYRLLNGYPFERHLDSLRVHAGDSVPLLELWRSIQTAVGRLQ